jgi:hypothetical protein
MKFLTLADWTGIVETELSAQTYKNYALATVRYPVLEVTAMVEPFENGRGFSLRILRAGKPRTARAGLVPVGGQVVNWVSNRNKTPSRPFCWQLTRRFSPRPL